MVLQKDTEKLHKRAFPWLSALFYALVLLVAPFISEYLFAVAFAVQIYRMLRYDLRINCIDLAFLIPFSSFYRLPGGISYIVIYILLFDVVFLTKNNKLSIGSGMALFLLTIFYIALRAGGQWNLLYFIFCGLFLLYLLYFTFKQSDHRGVLWGFIIGVLLSSAYALLFGDIPAIRSIVMRDAELNDDRFRGLLLDPNYYATLVVMAIVSLICLDTRKRVNRVVYYGVLAFLVFFGAQTASKSFVLMLLGVFAYYCFSLITQRKYFVGIVLLTAVAGATILAVSGKVEIFRAVIERFEKAEGMSGLTTGRTDIWMNYIRVVLADPFVLLFGRGLGAPLVGAHGTHNIVLETVYCFGLGGLILILAFCAMVLRKMRIRFASERKLPLVRFLPIIAILLMYLFLQGISSILFYLSLFVMYECYGCCISKAE